MGTMTEGEREEFQREVSLMKRMRGHPNVVRVVLPIPPTSPRPRPDHVLLIYAFLLFPSPSSLPRWFHLMQVQFLGATPPPNLVLITEFMVNGTFTPKKEC